MGQDILALDVGTSGLKAGVYTPDCLASNGRLHPHIQPLLAAPNA